MKEFILAADTLMYMLETAYGLGFSASAEGNNAEYPYADNELDYEEDPDWIKARDATIGGIMDVLNRLENK